MKLLHMLRQALRGDRLTQAAVMMLIVLFLCSLLSPLLPIGRPDQVGYGPRLGAPEWSVPFGTDQLGRSVLARVLQGVQTTFLLSTAAVLIAGALGSVVAMTTAYWSRTADEIASRFADVLFSFPPILMGIMVVAVLAPGVVSAIVVISVITFPTMLRVVRAATLSMMRRDFVIVAEITGVPFFRRVWVHLLPNVVEAITVQTIYSISVGMIIESALSFLGIGVQAPVASLGSLLRDGLPYLEIAPWLTFSAGLTLAAGIMAINLLGDGMRRLMDPVSEA